MLHTLNFDGVSYELRIDVERDWQLEYWSWVLDVTKEQLVTTVKVAGDRAEDVIRQLAMHRPQALDA